MLRRGRKVRRGEYDGCDPWTRVAKIQNEVAAATPHLPPHLPLTLTLHICLGESV